MEEHRSVVYLLLAARLAFPSRCQPEPPASSFSSGSCLRCAASGPCRINQELSSSDQPVGCACWKVSQQADISSAGSLLMLFGGGRVAPLVTVQPCSLVSLSHPVLSYSNGDAKDMCFLTQSHWSFLTGLLRGHVAG